MDIEALRSLQRSLNRNIDAYITAAEQDDSKDKKQILQNTQGSIYDAAFKLSQVTVEPYREIFRIGLQPTINMAIRIAIDLDLFNMIKQNGTLDELARKTKAEKSLLLRIIRTLAAVDIVNEVGINKYASTPISDALTISTFRDWIKICFDFTAPTWLEIPNFVAANSFKDIEDLDHNPTRKVWGANFFDALAQNPRIETDFASAMSLSDVQIPEFIPHYPFPDFIDEFNAHQQQEIDASNAIFLVDVGGGVGHYISRIIKENPGLPGRKVVQDLERVVARADTSQGFETAAHDFFTPQPIKHAKFYILRHILHDWPDSACIRILEQLRPAFQPGFSRLLLNGQVLPTSGVGREQAMLDLNMMTVCGKERNEAEWHELLGKAGFKITRIVRAQVGSLAVIDAALANEKELELASKL